MKIADLAGEGELIAYKPTTAPFSKDIPRALWLSKDVHVWCQPEGAHPDGRISVEALDALRSVLNDYVHRQELMLGLDMKRLDPHDRRVWEFRSYLGTPQLRVFGCFALENVFVATTCRVRSDLEEKRGPLWTKAIHEAAREFDRLVVDYPASAGSFRELVK